MAPPSLPAASSCSRTHGEMDEIVTSEAKRMGGDNEEGKSSPKITSSEQGDLSLRKHAAANDEPKEPAQSSEQSSSQQQGIIAMDSGSSTLDEMPLVHLTGSSYRVTDSSSSEEQEKTSSPPGSSIGVQGTESLDGFQTSTRDVEPTVDECFDGDGKQSPPQGFMSSVALNDKDTDDDDEASHSVALQGKESGVTAALKGKEAANQSRAIGARHHQAPPGNGKTLSSSDDSNDKSTTEGQKQLSSPKQAAKTQTRTNMRPQSECSSDSASSYMERKLPAKQDKIPLDSDDEEGDLSADQGGRGNSNKAWFVSDPPTSNPREPLDSFMSETSLARDEGTVDLEQSCETDVDATSVKVTADKIFAAPRGPRPKDMVWDHYRGEWTPKGDVAMVGKQDRGSGGSSDGDENDDESSANDKTFPEPHWPPKGMVWDCYQGVWTPPKDGMALVEEKGNVSGSSDDDDKSSVKVTADKTFPAPPWPRPKGMVWDRYWGEWTPKGDMALAEKQSNGSGSSDDDDDDDDDDDESSVNVNVAADKTFAVPRGPRPKGMVWDRYRGKWVPNGKGEEGSSSSDSVDDDDSIESGAVSKKRKRLSGDQNSGISPWSRIKKLRRSPDASTSKTPGGELDPEKRRRETRVGSRVYAQYGEEGFFWGVVTAVLVKRTGSSHCDQYLILFDDGDFLECATICHFISVDEYRATGFTDKPPPIPKHHAAKIKSILKSSAVLDTTSSIVSNQHELIGIRCLRQLFARRCNECRNCTKEDCGRCASCLSNRLSIDVRTRTVCFRKMCCKIPIEEKEQPMSRESGFPKGWTFVIDPTIPGYNAQYAKRSQKIVEVDGLKVFAPSHLREYYSAEGAKAAYSLALADSSPKSFYVYIGAMPGMPQLSPTRFPANGRGRTSCVCKNCTKDACGRCERCRASSRGVSRRCFQKMCFEESIEAKAAPAVGFPPGWRFYFAEAKTWTSCSKHKQIPTLWVISPSSKAYRSAEAGIEHKGLDGGKRIVRQFYKHVGLPVNNESQIQETRRESVTGQWSLSKNRVVGSRAYCTTKKKWGIIEKKFQLGKDKFRYSVRLECDGTLVKNLDDFCVLSEMGYQSKTGRKPPPPKVWELDSDSEARPPRSCHKITEESTVDEITTTTDNFLVGRTLCFVWFDLNGHQKGVYGKVQECQQDAHTGKVISYTVVYSSRSRAAANAVTNGCGSRVPESETLQPELILGACLKYEEQTSGSAEERLVDSYKHLPFSWHWMNPVSRRESIQNVDGKRFPRLTLVFRGNELVFDIKPSTIAGAGNGVFLSCTALVDKGDADTSDDEPEPFQLKAGELLDLGIYAPFRIQDKKPAAAFDVKNFIQSFRCEEYAFDPRDPGYQLDITDDTTGELHNIAKQHIPAYVNESNDENDICIWAEHDPEGVAHYLLGHTNESAGRFEVPADGSQVEVFVHYGAKYEKIRVQKGYSSLPANEREVILEQMENEDVADVENMDNFGAAEVEAAVNYLVQFFSTQDPSKFSGTVIDRSLTCATVLQRRAQLLLLDAGNTANSRVNLRKLLNVSRGLVTLILDFSNDDHDRLKILHTAGNVDGLLREVLERQYSEEQLGLLSCME